MPARKRPRKADRDRAEYFHILAVCAAADAAYEAANDVGDGPGFGALYMMACDVLEMDADCAPHAVSDATYHAILDTIGHTEPDIADVLARARKSEQSLHDSAVMDAAGEARWAAEARGVN